MRVKSLPVWFWYTVLRIVLFAVPLAVLLIAGVDPWVSAAVAAVFASKKVKAGQQEQALWAEATDNVSSTPRS